MPGEDVADRFHRRDQPARDLGVGVLQPRGARLGGVERLRPGANGRCRADATRLRAPRPSRAPSSRRSTAPLRASRGRPRAAAMLRQWMKNSAIGASNDARPFQIRQRPRRQRVNGGRSAGTQERALRGRRSTRITIDSALPMRAYPLPIGPARPRPDQRHQPDGDNPMTDLAKHTAHGQRDPRARHGRGPEGEVRPPRHADGHGRRRDGAVLAVPEVRPRRPALARPRPLRALRRPRLDAALCAALPDRLSRT